MSNLRSFSYFSNIELTKTPQKTLMDSTKYVIIHVLLIFQILAVPSCISSLDTITLNQHIKDGDVLLSSKKIFAVGFFSPGSSPSRYVRVGYNKVPEKTVGWVANRDNPITGTGQVMVVNGEHGGVFFYDKDQNTRIWSANVTISSPNSFITGKLLDTGNLLVLENNGSSSERLLWQGFGYPTNTMLPFMKLGLNRRSGKFRFRTSWKSEDDPGIGSCSYWIDPGVFPQMFLYKGQTPWWRAGTWTGERWAGLHQMTIDFIFNASFVNNEDELSDVFG